MFKMIKKDHIGIFLVIIAIVLGIIFYFTSRPVEDKNLLQYTAGCGSEKIDASIYSLRGDTSLIGAFVSFDEVPISDEVRSELTKLKINISEGTWTFDYALAEIPTESLCALADNDFVQSIFIPQKN